MREMIFRERQERVAHLDAIGKMIARVLGADPDKAFAEIITEYASEVFQETYDSDLLKRRLEARRRAQAAVRRRRQADLDLIKRLDRMGEYGDRHWNDGKSKKDK
jgi:hypothetical protein